MRIKCGHEGRLQVLPPPPFMLTGSGLRRRGRVLAGAGTGTERRSCDRSRQSDKAGENGLLFKYLLRRGGKRKYYIDIGLPQADNSLNVD